MADHIRSRVETERIVADVLRGDRTTHLLHDFTQRTISAPRPGDIVYVSTPQGSWRFVVRDDGSWLPNDESAAVQPRGDED